MKNHYLFFTAIFVVFICFSLVFSACDDAKEETVTEDVVEEMPIIEEEPEIISWQHSEEVDEMRGTTNTWDYIISDNSVDFDFPYNGGSKLKIWIRQTKKNGTDVYLTISNGQFSGSEYDNSNYVNIKFDDGNVQKYYFSEAADGSSDIIFLRNKTQLIKKFKTATSIMIEAPFYQEGRPLFKFHVDKPYMSE